MGDELMGNSADPEVFAQRRIQIVTLTKQGRTAREIADQLGVTPRTVVRHRKAAGISKPGPREFTARETLRAIELLDDGASYSEVARTLGRGYKAVRNNAPGYPLWDKQKAAETASLARTMRRLERQPPAAVATGGHSNTKGHNAA